MTTKHTPAPWIVETHYGILSVESEAFPGPYEVATVTSKSHADALLIASAPELLDALRKISETALAYPYSGVTCGEIARAAIAKASGSDCRNCGGDGYTHDAPRCPACDGTGKS